MISLAVFYLQTEIEKDSEYILAISKSIQDMKKSRKYCWERVSHLEQSLPSIKNPVDLDHVKNSILPDKSNPLWFKGLTLSQAKIDENFADYFLKTKANIKWFIVLKCKGLQKSVCKLER